MDLRQVKGLQIAKTATIQEGIDGWVVPSQSSNKNYFVRKNFSCTCPDCKDHKPAFCKHAYAVKYFLGFEKADGTVEKVRLTYKQAWHAYTQAQTTEVNQFDSLLKDLVQSIEEPEYKFGRPALSLRAQAFCSIQKVYSQLSSRRAKSLFDNAQTREYIKKAPNYNAVNKLMNKPEFTTILQRLVALSSVPLKEVETDFAIDSSGFRTTKFNDYCREKHGTKKEHHWVKCHICTGVKTNIITGVRITGENGADSPQFAPLVQEPASNDFEIAEVSADKAYSSRDNIGFVDSIGATAYIPFRQGATGKPMGKSHSWRKMFAYFMLNQEEFMQHYHKRSNVETTFHMLKMKFGDSLKSKNTKAQENELLCKIVAHNIVVLIHEIQALGVSVKF